MWSSSGPLIWLLCTLELTELMSTLGQTDIDKGLVSDSGLKGLRKTGQSFREERIGMHSRSESPREGGTGEEVGQFNQRG